MPFPVINSSTWYSYGVQPFLPFVVLRPGNQRKLAEHRWFRFLPLSRRLILSNAQNVDRSSKSVSDFLTLFFSNISDVLPHFANNFLCLFFFFF